MEKLACEAAVGAVASVGMNHEIVGAVAGPAMATKPCQICQWQWEQGLENVGVD